MGTQGPKETPLSQRELLAIFDADAVRAEARYLDLWQKLQRFFEWNRVSDSSDMVQETIARGLSNLQAGKKITSADPASYFFGIAKNLVKEGWKPRRSDQLESQEFPAETVEFLGLGRAEQRIYLKECLQELSQEDFDLLRAYTEGDTREWGLARGLRPGAVRLRVHRLRKRIDERVRASIGNAKKM
jgi:DNA-directed RNA polymerase specialized sigma24 family protein